MSGLEKIIGSITGEASEKAEKILKDAQEEAARITGESEKRTALEVDRITKKAQSEAASIKERSKASAELKSKQILLSGKQELISETIDKAKAYVGNLKDETYVKLIRAIFNRHVPKEDAVLMFNAKDQQRIPANVIAGFVQQAAENGARLTVSVKAADIKDGFILDFGGIEENCSIEALIDQNIEEIQDSVNRKLFS